MDSDKRPGKPRPCPTEGPYAEDVVRLGGHRCGEDWAKMGMTPAQARRMMAVFCEALTTAYEETRDKMPRNTRRQDPLSQPRKPVHKNGPEGDNGL